MSNKSNGRPEQRSMDGRPLSRSGWSLRTPQWRRAVCAILQDCGLRARRTGTPMMRMAAPAQRISSFILKLPVSAGCALLCREVNIGVAANHSGRRQSKVKFCHTLKASINSDAFISCIDNRSDVDGSLSKARKGGFYACAPGCPSEQIDAPIRPLFSYRRRRIAPPPQRGGATTGSLWTR